MDYEVITADDVYTLARKVKDTMRKGYRPTGGISVSPWNTYMQAVYKEAN